ncbi:hypothetical protein PMAYCL1PPCAC_06629, partial [Pristionchus mayeri]
SPSDRILLSPFSIFSPVLALISVLFRMSFMKSFFGKGKKKEEKEEPKKEANQFKRDQTRRSVHLGDRSFGPEHLSSFYQSVGHKYPKGPKSCPGERELRDGDDESMGARPEFSHKRRSNRGILLNRREERNSDYSSQDPSPMSSHFSRRERETAPPRHYHSSLDESDEENMDYHVMDRIREKLRKSEEEKMTYVEKYNEMKRYCKDERKEREKEKTRHTEVIDLLRQQNKELKNTNTLLKTEIEKWRRKEEQDRYESSFDSHSNSQMKAVNVHEYNMLKTQVAELRQIKAQLESVSRTPFASMGPFGQFPPLPFTNTFNYRSNSTSTPSTSIVGESTHDGAGESLVDPADNSYRPFDASLSETMPPLFSQAFPFSAPPPATETPRSENRTSSTLSLHDQSVTLADSSFRPPVPSSMPPRRISQSDTALSPPRKSSHSL